MGAAPCLGPQGVQSHLGALAGASCLGAQAGRSCLGPCTLLLLVPVALSQALEAHQSRPGPHQVQAGRRCLDPGVLHRADRGRRVAAFPTSAHTTRLGIMVAHDRRV